MNNFKPIHYENGTLILLDQTKLPQQTVYREYTTYEGVAEAITEMVVRGAPAIGMSGAYGAAIAARQFQTGTFQDFMNKALDILEAARPTAVNLKWAITRIRPLIDDDVQRTIQRLETEAAKIYEEDKAINYQIGEHLLKVMPDDATILTHCNPGALATAAYGTATAPIYLAHERGQVVKVYSDETRPRLQGALTAYELKQAGIDVTTITDSTAATLMQQGKIDIVIVGCDRIALNGDVVNKIGTMPLAIAAKYYNIPFYVAAPTPSIDITTLTGQEIPIEERDGSEVTHIQGQSVSVPLIDVYNPAFDITPHELITGIVTEHGIIEADETAITQLFGGVTQ